jgi:endo-1,4-beta-D-glucanase Y
LNTREKINDLVISGRYRVLLTALILALACTTAAAAGTPITMSRWALWERYANEQITADGRVVEPEKQQRTTSEAQAYASFFAVVARDRPRFDALLGWTSRHLWPPGSDLPAWLWGQRSDGSFGLLDGNSASDADLWLAYALLEAARVWHDPRYRALANRLLHGIAAHEVWNAGPAGSMLIPGKQGFRLADHSYQLNPSYAPVQLLRRFEDADPEGPWVSVARNEVKLIVASASQGFVPDWYSFSAQAGYSVLRAKGPTGGFDAVRTYLWAGMLDRQDPAARQILPALSGMAWFVASAGHAPLYVNVATGQAFGIGSIGFSAAVLPLMIADGHERPAQTLAQRIEAATGERTWSTLRYYDRNLLLFATGWLEHRYRFAANGTLLADGCSDGDAMRAHRRGPAQPARP